jgi:hypothetical protein
MWKISAALLMLGLALLGLGIFRAVTANSQAVPAPPLCFFPQEKDRLIILAHEAIDEAYKNKVKDLFDIWVRDPVDQPRRAVSGMAIALSAYHRARANVRVWDPPLCDMYQ